MCVRRLAGRPGLSITDDFPQSRVAVTVDGGDRRPRIRKGPLSRTGVIERSSRPELARIQQVGNTACPVTQSAGYGRLTFGHWPEQNRYYRSLVPEGAAATPGHILRHIRDGFWRKMADVDGRLPRNSNES
jgi:hypothetical protein